MVYVISKDGHPLMPTTRHSKVRRMLASGIAVVVRRCPFTIKLLKDTGRATVNLAEYFKHISMAELGKTYLLADLRDAFSELSGKFCYGQGKLVFGAELNLKEYIGYFNGTIIHERLLNDVLAHPEAYALITVYYD